VVSEGAGQISRLGSIAPLTRPPARPSRRILAAVAVVAAILLPITYAARHAGVRLVAEDPLATADAIVVLAGTRMERPLEAADLYREGWAPVVVLTGETRDGGERAIAARGLHYPRGPELVRDVYVKIGIPERAILVAPGEHDSTADEARTLTGLASQRRWNRVIVVTSKLHTARAGYVMRRALGGLRVDVRLRASRYDRADPEHWWRSREDIRFVLFEWQKVLLYVLQVG